MDLSNSIEFKTFLQTITSQRVAYSLHFQVESLRKTLNNLKFCTEINFLITKNVEKKQQQQKIFAAAIMWKLCPFVLFFVLAKAKIIYSSSVHIA